MRLPYAPAYAADMTRPGVTEERIVPVGAAKSRPVWRLTQRLEP